MLCSHHFPFLQLPLELRLEIYCYVLRGTQRSDALTCDIDSSILQTCKHIRLEGQPCLFKVNMFEVAVSLPVSNYMPWPVLPSNRKFLSRVQHLALYYDASHLYLPVPIQLESLEMRRSFLHLKQICMSLIHAGTNLQTLKITVKVSRNISFGHMAIGQYPFLTIPFARSPLLRGSNEPDVLAPLKELRVRRAILVGDFSGAPPATIAYLHNVKEILEGCTSNDRGNTLGNPELGLDFDVDLMMGRKIYYYASALELPTWQDIVHRELLFYTTALQEYYLQNSELRNKLEGVRLMLSHGANEKLKGLAKLKLGPILLLLEEVYRGIVLLWKQWGFRIPSDLVAAREYFMARPEIGKIVKSPGLTEPKELYENDFHNRGFP